MEGPDLAYDAWKRKSLKVFSDFSAVGGHQLQPSMLSRDPTQAPPSALF